MADFWLLVARKAFWISLDKIGETTGSLIFTFIVLALGASWVFLKEGFGAMKSRIAQSVIGAPVFAWLLFFLYYLILATPYLQFAEERQRANEEQKRANKAVESGETKDEVISTQKETIQDLESRLKEQQKLVYKESKSSPQASRPATPNISNLLVEVRALCTLRDSLKVPNNIGDAYFPEMTSFLEGTTGKAYLRPITNVRFQRTEEEGKASTVLRYELPSNSDLVGKPVSSLSDYKRMRITLWAIDHKAFTECGFLEATLRINGLDVLRQPLTKGFETVPGRSVWVEISLNAMKLPE